MISIDLHTHSRYSTNRYFGRIGTDRMIETAIQKGINISNLRREKSNGKTLS